MGFCKEEGQRQISHISTARYWSTPCCISCLTNKEEGILHDYIALGAHGQICDVGQNPHVIKMHSRDGKLHTLTAGLGLLVDLHHGRIALKVVLLMVMGWPITDEQVLACAGTKCQFSRGVAAPESRSHATVCHAIGNAMHVNAMGAFSLLLPIVFPF